MPIIELRSDTYTKPNAAMREAMANAEVGNDGVDEDPTVNLLQKKAAAMLGKEAALFVASGTMGNLCAVLAHCQPSDTVVLDRRSHLFCDESGCVGAVAHCQTLPLECTGGAYDINELEAALGPARTLINSPTTLVCMENTHNRRGGLAVAPEVMRETYELVQRHGIAVHLDGARIFNAATALGVDAKAIAQHADSVQFCLSKGLGCPIGSILLGRADFIARAKRARRMLGGGMRQAGVIAAAGIVALDTMIDRLADDHRRAARLAEGLTGIAGLTLTVPPQSNMVFLEADPDCRDRLVAGMVAHGIKFALTGNSIRMVVHCDITDDDINTTINAFTEVLSHG